MADDKKSKRDEEAPAEVVAAPAGGKKRTIMIVGGIVAALFLVGAPVAYFSLSKKSVENESLSADAAHGEGEQPAVSLNEDEYDEGEEPLGAFFPLDSFVVNLQGGRYLRCQVQLEFTEREVPKRFYSRLVLVRDAIIALLSRKSESELANENGKNALKGELKDIVNEVLKRQEIKQIYFTQFVIQ